MFKKLLPYISKVKLIGNTGEIELASVFIKFSTFALINSISLSVFALKIVLVSFSSNFISTLVLGSFNFCFLRTSNCLSRLLLNSSYLPSGLLYLPNNDNLPLALTFDGFVHQDLILKF